MIDQSLLRPLDISVSRLDPRKAREKLGWEARHKGRRLAELLVKCEQEIRLARCPGLPDLMNELSDRRDQFWSTNFRIQYPAIDAYRVFGAASP